MIPATVNIDIDPAFERIANADRRFRYVALFLAFGFGMFAIATCGCTLAPRTPRGYATASRDEVDQMRGTVLIEVVCVGNPFTDRPNEYTHFNLNAGTGSGTVLDGIHILTAAHVVQCDFLEGVRVTTYDGRHIIAHVDRIDQKLDLARLLLDDPVALGFSEPTIAVAKAEQVICGNFAYPYRGASCGSVLGMRQAGESDIIHDARTEHGNSGGGVFIDGALVGVITRLIPCNAIDPWLVVDAPGCGGMATSLAGRHADWFGAM